jgi:hypothetical protein
MQFGVLEMACFDRLSCCLALLSPAWYSPECGHDVILHGNHMEIAFFYATLSTCRLLQTRSDLSNVHRIGQLWHTVEHSCSSSGPAQIILLHDYCMVAFGSCRYRNDVEVCCKLTKYGGSGLVQVRVCKFEFWIYNSDSPTLPANTSNYHTGWGRVCYWTTKCFELSNERS